MPKESKLDHFLSFLVVGILAISSLSAVYFGYKTYIANSQENQPENLLVLQNKNVEEGKVLSGGSSPCDPSKIFIKNNNFSPTSVTATYDNSKNKWCVIFNLDIASGEPNRTLVADYTSWSQTLCTSGCSGSATRYYSTSGTYSYHLESNTTAKVTVQAGTSPPPPPSSDSSSSSSSTGTTTTTTTEKETLKDVSLPKEFTAKGSKTTNLAKIADLKKVKGFTLDVKGKNRIVFKEVLNLSSDKLVSLFKKLDKYVKMSKSGIVSLDSKTIPALNKKASLTMFSLPHLFEPEVLVDGKKDTKKVVSNLVYDKKSGNLTFNVSHFSTLEATPKIEILDPSVDKVEEQNPVIKGRVSDPNAVLTARFNDQDINEIPVDKETGEFMIDNLTFKEGENFLTIEAKSKLGKVLPVVKTITYQPKVEQAALVKDQTNYPLLITSLITALVFFVLAGYLIYRKRKHFSPQALATNQTLPPKV